MKELIKKYVGKIALVKLSGLDVEVKIVDIKKVYGKLRYEIVPCAGVGATWVENLTLVEDK